MKKKPLAMLLIGSCVAFSLMGCSSSKSYTFDVQTGDKVEVTMDTSDGYSMDFKDNLNIYLDDELQMSGVFITEEQYEEYEDVIKQDSKAELIEKDEKDNLEYLHWKYDDEEYNYAIKIEDSDTGVLLGSLISEEAAQECFNRLSFDIE